MPNWTELQTSIPYTKTKNLNGSHIMLTAGWLPGCHGRDESWSSDLKIEKAYSFTAPNGKPAILAFGTMNILDSDRGGNHTIPNALAIFVPNSEVTPEHLAYLISVRAFKDKRDGEIRLYEFQLDEDKKRGKLTPITDMGREDAQRDISAELSGAKTTIARICNDEAFATEKQISKESDRINTMRILARNLGAAALDETLFGPRE